MDHYYALIMAGGGGTRLWPLSRKNRPKQVLPLTEERTMFQVTVERVRNIFPPDHIYIVTGRELASSMQDIAPEIPSRNFIIEPTGRDSGPAAGLGTAIIAERDPEAVIAVLSADHHIANEQRFCLALECAYGFAEQGHLITLGIEPSYAATGFGYIQRGDVIAQCGDFTMYQSRRFTEKPDETTAQAFIASGLYSWNAGIFIWKASQALAEFQRQQPDMYNQLTQIAAAPDHIDQIWKSIKKISLDYAIMEGAKNIAIIPVEIGWSDIGTWATLFDVLKRDEYGNATRSTTDGHIQIDTHDTLIVSDKMVVTIGIDNLVIVETKDAILVCHKDRAQDVRDAVQQLKDTGRESHL
jgi:mannose-1-phosphate guanylyltransferase